MGVDQLKLTKSPIPLTVAESNIVFTGDDMRASRIPVDLVDPLPWTVFPLGAKRMSEEPLIRFKLTTLPVTEETALVVHACHVLGVLIMVPTN